MNFQDSNQKIRSKSRKGRADAVSADNYGANQYIEPSGRMVFLTNLILLKRNLGKRLARKTTSNLPLPAMQRPQNLMAIFIILVGIAMLTLDIPTYPWIHRFPEEYRWFFSMITDVGKSHWILLSTGAFMVISLFFDWSRLVFRTRMLLYILWTYSCFIFVVVASSGIIAIMLKWSLGRARPNNFEELGTVYFDMFHFTFDYTSFPSGHSTTIAALGASLCLLFPGWFWFIVAIGFWLVFSRIMVGAHYPSDVIAGTMLGIAVTLWTARFLAIRRLGFRVVLGNGLRRFAGKVSFYASLKSFFGRTSRQQKMLNDASISDGRTIEDEGGISDSFAELKDTQ